MRISIVSLGVTANLARTLLRALAEYNADAYRRRPELPRIDRLNVRYVPDTAGRSIDLVAVDTLSRRIGDGMLERVSCGSAAAAWAGWMIARGRSAEVDITERAPGRWHAVAWCGTGMWDPEIAMRGK